MQEKGLYWKLLFILLIFVWAIFEITPVEKQLKGGIDLVGGHSLLYEMDAKGVKNTSDLSTRVMERLKVRVDPEGVRNLVWRPVGDTRLEIQMPLPPAAAVTTREAFTARMEALRATNVRVQALERALNLTGESQTEAMAALTHGVAAREELLKSALKTYKAWKEALAAKKGAEIVEDLEQDYERHLDQLLATNVDLRKVNDALDLDPNVPERDKRLAELKVQYPARAALIDKAIEAHAAWSKVKGPLDDPADLMRLLKGQGVLDFRILPVPSPDNPEEFSDYFKRLEERGPRPRPEDQYAWYEIKKPESFHGGTVRQWGGKSYVLAYQHDPLKVLDRSRDDWKLTQAYPTSDQNNMPAVGFEFNEIGASYFLELTRNNINQPLCILLDDKAISAPNIQSAISNRGVITGDFSQEEVNYLISTLNAGSLEARLKENPISVHSIGPSLGQDNRQAGFRAGVYGLIAVLAFMLIYYMWAGLIADFALFMNLLVLLGAMAALEATFTMAGVAGIILTMGMAVDANVLIYERMREEAGKLQSLRLIIKNGYDRAMSTILDANITTLITCVVLYYIGTEEIKGFALTLGLGLVISMFTALFVTRTVFIFLVQANVIKSLPMLRFFKRPNVNWLAKQKYAWVVSLVLLAIGIVSFPLRGEDKYDIEFRGGTSAQIEMKSPGLLKIGEVREKIKEAGQSLETSGKAIATGRLAKDADRQNKYSLTVSGTPSRRLEAALQSFMYDELEKNSIEQTDANTVSFRVKPELKLDQAAVSGNIKQAAIATSKTGQQLAGAQVQSIGRDELNYEIITTATAQSMVINAITSVMGDSLNIESAIQFDPDIKTYPITKNRLSAVIGDPKAPGYIREYLGGAAFVVGKLQPAVQIDRLKERIKAMRLQPDFEKLQWRDLDIIGLTAAPGQDLSSLSEDQVRYTRVAVVVVDPNALYEDDEGVWQTSLAGPELSLLKESLGRATELQKVTQFAAQVASQAKLSATMALIIAFGAIIMYLWIRFGTPRHGIAAVIALLHDVTVCMAFVTLASLVSQTPLGELLMLQDFKINLAMVAAFLTVVGYSVNDTIVVYDRIRENRGKLKEITPNIINDAFNQTLSRTVLTSLTTLIVMVILFIFGGEGVHGFSFVMIIGTIVGTYSSIAIASPLLLGWLGALGRKRSTPQE